MIRGFKLEMSDAQHITDVYSEVAAISASDTQELAIAMSKTASSAASVGMSFENTTAMIATMVEATRESATNIGSAMKSIISRMSEMKAGLSQDENGEFLDASKVETALKSVKVALRDTQGQFRDLDTVLIELGSKWSTLDSATKRYLGTIIAGNRQQSRFLALMENYERFTEIQESAMNAEDASVLQYAKTLDSLETKLNQISNSFQQFYMSIANGPVVGGFLEILNNVITNLSSYDPVTSITKVLSLISSLKNVIQLIFTTITAGAQATMTQIKENQNAIFGSAPGWAESIGRKIAQGIQKGLADEANQTRAAVEGGVQAPTAKDKSATRARWAIGLGTAFQMAGLGISQNTMGGYWTSNVLQAAGGLASTYGQALVNPIGAVVTGVTTVVGLVEAIANADEKRLENLKSQTEEANVERVQAKKDASDLQSYIDKEQRLRKARYDSAEAAQAYTNIQNEIAEKYPQYISYLDESGNAIVNMTSASKDLAVALAAAGEKAEEWAKKQIQLNADSYQAAEQKIRGQGYRKTQEELANFDIERYYYNEYSEAGSWIPKETLKQAFTAGGDFKTEEDRLKAAAAVVGAEGSSLADIISALNARVANNSDNDLTASMEYWVLDFLGEVLAFDKKTNTYTVSEGYKNYLEKKKALDATDAITRPVLTSVYSSQYLNAEANKTNAGILSRFSGEEAILAQLSKIQKKDVSKYTYEDYQTIADEFANFLGSLSSNGARIMQEYLDDLSAQSWNDISKFIGDRGADPESNIYKAFSAAYEAQASVAKENLIKQLTETGYAGNIPNLLNTLSVNQMKDYTEALANILSRQDEQGNYTSEYAEQASKQQIELLKSIYDNVGKIPIDLFEKLITDFGSFDWYTNFTDEDWQKIAKLNYNGDIKAAKQNFQAAIYQQLSTTISNASDKVSELAEEYVSASEKSRDSGFDLTAAKELIHKFGLDLDKFAEYFMYDRLQGKYRLTEEALAEMRDKATYNVEENISKNADALKALTSKEAVTNAILGYNLQEAEALQTALDNSLDSNGNLDQTLWQKNIDELVEQGKLSRDYAASLLISSEVQGIINSQKDFQNKLEPSLESIGEKYIKDDGQLNEDLLKIDGLFYDTATGQLIAGLDYYEELLKDESGLDDNQLNYVREKRAELKESQTNLGYEFIGKITTSQIQLLRQLYGDDAVANLVAGDQTWTGEEDIFVGHPELATNRRAGMSARLKNATNTLISAIADIATGVEVDAQELANAFADTGLEISVGNLADILSGKYGDPLEKIQAAYKAALESAGVPKEELNKLLAELSIRIVETIADAIDSGISLLAKGITEGLGSEDLTSLRNLAKAQGIDERTFNSYYTMNNRTGRAQFTDSGALALANTLTEKYGSHSSAMKELADAFQGRGGILNSYDTVDKEIKRIESSTEKWTDAEKEHLKQLKEIRAIYANIADSQRFDFMGYDMMQGQMDDFDNWIGSIQQVQDVFQGLSDSGGKMNYKNFLSMIDYIQKFHPDASGLQIAGQSLDQFAVAIMNTVDIAGNVDFSKVADAMTQGVGQMADAMKETLAEVARERIKTLEATKAALVAQLAVEKALKAMGGKLPTIEWEGKTEKEGLRSIQKWKDTLNKQAKDIIDTMDDLTEEQKAASKAYLDSFPFGQQILDALGFKPEDMAKWSDEQKALFNQLLSSLDFGSIIEQAISSVQASGISFSNTEEFMAAFSMEFQRAVLKGWDENQPKEGLKLEAPNAKIVGDTQIEVPSTTTTTTTSTEAKDTTKALTDTAAAIDKAEEAFKNLGQTGQEEIEKIKTAITDLTTQLDGLKESFNLGTTETPMEIQLKAVIGEYTNAPGIDPNKQVENLNGTVGSFAPTAEGETSKKSLVDSLVATVSSFLPATGVDANSLVSDLTAIVNLSSDPEELYKNIVAYMSTKKVDVAVQLANSGNEQELATLWPNLSTVEQALVQVMTQGTAAETAVGNVVAKYGTLGAASLATGMLVGAAESSNQSNLAKTGEAVGNVSTKYGETSAAAGDASTTIAETEKANQDNIKKTGDAAGVAKKKIADMARGKHEIKVDANTKPAIKAANQAVKDIEAKSATVTVTYRSEMTEVEKQNLRIQAGEGMPEPPKKGGLWNTVKSWFGGGKYQGTVNDLGPAYAQGTKTLVGELGPELAVYDNAYHLLGRNGAELVDIPDDAIIFNHKQTEGILKGQANNGRGKTVNGQPAFATGNVDGPAYAGGLSGAIAAIDREIMAWKALLSMTTADLLGSAGGGGGGGGSGNTLKAHIEDLVEWYNLTRQIADIEQKINNIIAKRANITDGRAYLKSLREQQHLLEGQALVQKTLLGYQQKQLELQAEQINTHDIWKQFFHVGSDGLLQYNMGNEVNGGKGTLTLLQQLNQMSGAEQLSYIKNLGYSYVTNDGEQLDGEDLVSKFFEEAQAQIDKYDELRDTVESTDEALSKLESSINEIEQEIRDNQKELEEIIYNTLVEAWEKQISQLQEQTDMLREANEAYVNGLNDALNKERNQYSQNKSISDRQQLQRQLSLLRRSGGSASQIASLEEQLNSALKEEYFSHQQETIDSIKEANDKQLDALNKQITLQQETLDFQKENGVLWTKVYEVLAQSDGKIMEFLIQNSSEFIQASALAQADMLNEEWAKRIGIYKANSEEGFEPYVQKANQMFATEAWNSAEGPQKQSMFNALDVASQKALQDYFASAFANEMLRNGGNEAAAYEVARQDMYQKLYQAYNQMKNIQNTTLDAIRNISQPNVAPKDNAAGSGGGASGGGKTSGDKDGSGSSKKQWLRITYRGLVTTGNSKGKSNGGSPSGPSSLEVGKSGAISWNCYPGFVQGGFDVSDTSKCSVSGSTITALASGSVTITLKYWDRTPKPAGLGKATTTVKNDAKSSSSTTKTGGGSSGKSLLKKNLFANSLYAASGAFIESDDTPAILHKGEGVFTASETSALRNMVKNYQTLAANLTGNSLLSAMSGIGSYSFSNTRNAGSELNINPGAVVIHVDKLDDKYDVDELATDVFNKLSTIASKATNRGVNRR